MKKITQTKKTGHSGPTRLPHFPRLADALPSPASLHVVHCSCPVSHRHARPPTAAAFDHKNNRRARARLLAAPSRV